ncbi:hypothetical protein GCM10010376_61530 [Streptomyces violaceusniger]
MQALLRAEVAEHAGLAHPQFGRQPTDGQSLQTIHGCESQTTVNDALAGAAGLKDGVARTHDKAW